MTSVAIIVEGKSDEHFFKAYLTHLQFGPITDVIREEGGQATDGILLRQSGGVDVPLSSASLPTLRSIYNACSKVLVIWDANRSPDDRRKKFWQRVQEEKMNEDIFSLFLLPDDSRQGELENLLEDISTKKDIHNCFDEYKDCLENNPDVPPLKEKVYLKGKIYDYCIAMGVEPHEEKRDYTDKELWDLDSEKLNALKDFLQSNI